MTRVITKLLGIVLLLALGSAGLWYYQHNDAEQRIIRVLEQEKAELQEQHKVLTLIVERLNDEKRVAEVLVTDQKTVDGVKQTSLLFVEYDKAGNAQQPMEFTVVGDVAHIDALVIKFDQKLVEQADPLRGRSIALFTRIYGDHQSPANAFAIDREDQIPAVYHLADPKVTEFEMKLWREFWNLTRDQAAREAYGVRIANGQGVWGPFEPDVLYTITLESDGGLNITSEPLKAIYREALKQRLKNNPVN